MKVYKPKISKWRPVAIVLVGVVMIFIFTLGMFAEKGLFIENYQLSLTIILLVILLFLVAPIFKLLRLRYAINGKQLLIRIESGRRTAIDIQKINKIEKGYSFILPAGCTTHHPLEIYFNNYDMAKVSPKNEENFIRDLLKINPDIEIIRNSDLDKIATPN